MGDMRLEILDVRSNTQVVIRASHVPNPNSQISHRISHIHTTKGRDFAFKNKRRRVKESACRSTKRIPRRRGQGWKTDVKEKNCKTFEEFSD
jgi:hypothetical protein